MLNQLYIPGNSQSSLMSNELGCLVGVSDEEILWAQRTAKGSVVSSRRSSKEPPIRSKAGAKNGLLDSQLIGGGKIDGTGGWWIAKKS